MFFSIPLLKAVALLLAKYPPYISFPPVFAAQCCVKSLNGEYRLNWELQPIVDPELKKL
jgi:hypothetical protein